MDAATLTNQVMTALAPIVPYLSSAGTAIAGKVGEDVYQQGKKLYEAIRTRFAKEPDGGKASKALQAFVDDPDVSGAVEIKLQRLIQSDPAFADTLRQIIHAGPQQVIDATDAATVRKNTMKNMQRHGFQGIRASGEALVEENEQTICDE
ncbi:MAG: hypothetical protein JO202_06785 [Ktedonobacteraceae bacterium]|nr:hypothetical protein [Ktedonobacteraceae bacterium]